MRKKYPYTTEVVIRWPNIFKMKGIEQELNKNQQS